MGVESFWTILDSVASAEPDRVVVTDDYGRSLTTAGLATAAERAAAGLRLEADQVVSWQLPTTLEAVVVLTALARVGAVQNPIIPILRQRDVGTITAAVGSSLLIVPEVWRGFDHGAMARALPGLDVVMLDLADEPGLDLRLPTGELSSLPEPPTDGDGCRWVYFSSGTTAAPKGARHTDASVMASALGMVSGLGFGPDDVYPIAWPFSHIGGITMLTAALTGGGRLVLFDTFDPAITADRMAAHRPTILGTSTPFFRAFIDAQRRHGGESLYPALRTCAAGGAPTPPEINREMVEAFGIRGITSAWGLTEFPIATCASPDDPPEILATSVGPASPGVEVRVVDGELRLRGAQCFAGYVDSSLDAAAFDADGWFRTGDLGRVDADGNVFITGRLKDVIIRNAENISALEIEDVLLKHPDVADVAVIGLPDVRTGERVCAVVVTESDRTVTLDSLSEHCRAVGLARQKCPEQLEIVESIARNPMGKILKQELRDAITDIARP